MANLSEQIKDAIGYTEEPTPSCRNCKYRKETENTYVERMWDNTCHIAGKVVVLHVEEGGRCNKFEKAL